MSSILQLVQNQLDEKRKEVESLRAELDAIKTNGICRINNTYQSWSSAEYKFNELKADIEKLRGEMAYLRGYARASLHFDRIRPVLEMNMLRTDVLQLAERYSLVTKEGWRYEPTKLLTGEK